MAVQQCIQEGILREYLLRKGSEVINMLIAEYDYDTDIRVQREEAAEEAAKKATEKATKATKEKERAKELASIKEAIQNGALTLSNAVRFFHLTPDEMKAF